MFDDLICYMSLPNQPRPPECRLFQTKGTPAQLMETFILTASGRLIHHTVRYEDVPLSECPYPDMPFIGCMRRIPTGDIDTNFHGRLRFYTYDSETRELDLRSDIHRRSVYRDSLRCLRTPGMTSRKRFRILNRDASRRLNSSTDT